MAEPLKHEVGDAVVDRLAVAAGAHHAGFDEPGFRAAVVAAYDDLELKDRIDVVADELRRYLPAEYETALPIGVAMAGEDGIEGFAAWPLCSFVERHGLDHPDASLAAMEVLTQRFSCEFTLTGSSPSSGRGPRTRPSIRP